MSSVYTVEKSKLDAIANAIQLKRDITTGMTIDDMPLQIGLIDGGGLPTLCEKISEITIDEDKTNDSTGNSNALWNLIKDNTTFEYGMKYMYISVFTNNNAVRYQANCIFAFDMTSSDTLGYSIRADWSNIGGVAQATRSFYCTAGTVIKTYKIDMSQM